MCFTVNVNLVKEELENRYGATLLDPDKYRPSYYYHAFGLPRLPVIASDSPAEIKMMTWGLIPSWVRSSRDAEEIRLKTFNARSDSVDTKPSFSGSFSSKRCIVPVRGFFEWQHTSSGKIPWYIYRADNDIMSLAGLWAKWTDSSTGVSLSTFSVITTDANRLMSEIHNSKKRMPVVIEKESESEWLSQDTDVLKLKQFLQPYPELILQAHTISDLINRQNAERNTPELIRQFNRAPENLLF